MDTDTDTGRDAGNTEAMKAGNKESKAAVGRKSRFGKRVFTGLSGWNVGKTWKFYRIGTGFYRLWASSTRLFSHNSTQVVDFPHLAVVSIFCEDVKCWQKRGNKLKGMGIITRTWITEALGETGGAMKENA